MKLSTPTKEIKMLMLIKIFELIRAYLKKFSEEFNFADLR